MNVDRLPERHAKGISRRGFLGTTGIGLICLLPGVGKSAEEGGLPPPRFLLEWGGHGQGEGEFSGCVGIAIGVDDAIYTAEFHNQRVQKFSREGAFRSSFSIQPHAGGLAVDEAGNVYVAHWNSNKLAAYSPTGTLLREWGTRGTADGEFQLPGSVSYGPDGLLYVPDQGNSRVQKFTTEGKFVAAWGTHGSEPGQFGGGQPVGGRFAGPQFVAFDRAGNVYTTDAALDRVQKFTPDGKLLECWGGESTALAVLARRDRQGTLVMGDPWNLRRSTRSGLGQCHEQSRSAVFQRREIPARSGGAGSESGQFNLPHGIALDSRDCLYVVDTMNARIQKFALD